MLSWLEAQIDPFERNKIARPPDGLWRFYWHFVRPVWPVFSLVLFLDLLAALTEVALAKFVADLIDLLKGITTPASSSPITRACCCGWRSWCFSHGPRSSWPTSSPRTRCCHRRSRRAYGGKRTVTCCGRASVSSRTTSPGVWPTS